MGRWTVVDRVAQHEVDGGVVVRLLKLDRDQNPSGPRGRPVTGGRKTHQM